LSCLYNACFRLKWLARTLRSDTGLKTGVSQTLARIRIGKEKFPIPKHDAPDVDPVRHRTDSPRRRRERSCRAIRAIRAVAAARGRSDPTSHGQRGVP